MDAERIYFFALTAYDDGKHAKESKLSEGVSTLRITSPEKGFYVNASSYTSYRITGKTAAGAVVEIFAAKTSLGKTTADMDGNWQINADFSAIKEGSVDLTVESKGSISYPVSGILDISAPQLISQPSITNKKDTFVIIEWKTDEETASVIEYGPDISYGFTKADNKYTKKHAALLTNLNADTNYHYRISSTDAAGNGPEVSWTDNNPSIDNIFLTNPSTPPKIIEPPIIYRESNEIKLTFDEPNLQNTFVEANYNFSPSLNFFSPEASDDILQIDDFSYILRMGSIPEHEIFILRLSNIADSSGNLVTPATITINDTDRDNMADDWERDHGLETSVNDGAEDWDEDEYTNLQEYRSLTNPRYSGSAPFIIKDAIPQNNAGISTATRVLNDTSVAFLIESARGVNINELDSIRFLIDDGYHESYERDLSSDTVRVVKISDDDDRQVKRFWVVYDRSLETFMPDSYLFEAMVNISISVRDVFENQMNTAVDNFRVESEEEHRVAQKNLPDTWDVDPTDPDLDGVYDLGIEVIGGELAGAKIIYNSSELRYPVFGSIDEIEALNSDGQESVGIPMNLLPHTIFDTPVKIFIPCPGDCDLDRLSVYYFNGSDWLKVCDAQGNVLSDGEGLMVPGSRINHHDRSVPLIEIQAYHFSGVQAAGPASNNVLAVSSGDSGSGGGGGGCFISSAAKGDRSTYLSLTLIAVILTGMLGFLFYHRKHFKVPTKDLP